MYSMITKNINISTNKIKIGILIIDNFNMLNPTDRQQMLKLACSEIFEKTDINALVITSDTESIDEAINTLTIDSNLIYISQKLIPETINIVDKCIRLKAKSIFDNPIIV